MSKLAPSYQFLDLSDYGRPLARICANRLKSTRFTPIHITLLFGISGLIAIYCILRDHYFIASFFIILKSIIDAVDGELARAKKTPSYTGRYLDSIFDLLLNFMLLMAICYVSETAFWLTLLAFIGIQLQGTLYNYYYVILRNNSAGGDATSQIFEDKSPEALPGESQKAVNIMFAIYTIVYGIFDKIIHALDSDAYKVKTFPNWFMTLVSLYGLGFQLLLIAVLLPLGLIEIIAPFFVAYSVLIFVLIGIRKVYIK
jgi:phosphatidylglycerophosphate synthase